MVVLGRFHCSGFDCQYLSNHIQNNTCMCVAAYTTDFFVPQWCGRPAGLVTSSHIPLGSPTSTPCSSPTRDQGTLSKREDKQSNAQNNNKLFISFLGLKEFLLLPNLLLNAPVNLHLLELTHCDPMYMPLPPPCKEFHSPSPSRTACCSHRLSPVV